MSSFIKRAIEKRRARDLKPKPQVRKSFPAEEVLRQLAKSVIKGQIHPLIVWENIILDGECRWRGMMLENPDFEFDVIPVDRDLSASEICLLQLNSSNHSNLLSAYDLAAGCKALMDQSPGATAKEISEKIDMDQTRLSKHLSLWKTIPPVIKAAEEGKIGVTDWHEISKHPEAAQAGLLAFKLSGATRDQLVKAGKNPPAKTTSSLTVKLSRARYPVGSTGVVVTVSGPDMTLSQYIESLQAALDAARKSSRENLDIRTAERVWRDRAKAI